LWPIQRAYTEWVLETKNKSEVELIMSLTGKNQTEIEKIMAETNFEARALVQYSLVRIIKPRLVVETGVNKGLSSAAILTAMERNQEGELYSIDLPTESQLTDGTVYQRSSPLEVGRLVPYEVRHRWHLILGDAKNELPKLMDELKNIDIFLHDSLHTEEHMMWEFTTAWPYIREGGFLCSDDIGVSFLKFAKKHECKKWGCSGPYSTKLGVIVK
jgi:hypothetical protein